MENKNSYRSSTYHLIIEEYDILNKKHISELDINNYLKDELKVKFYAFIKHDSDLNDKGEKEHIHYHVIISLNSSYAKSTILHSFANALNCNVDIIQARKIKSFVLSVQYLLHLNDKDKFQYDYLDIWTNDVNELYGCLYASVSTYELDIDYLYCLVQKANSLAQIYRVIGLEKSKRYRSLIVDMYREEHIERFL